MATGGRPFSDGLFTCCKLAPIRGLRRAARETIPSAEGVMPVLGKLAPIVRYIYRTIAAHISVLSAISYGKLVADSPIIPHLVPLTVCWPSWVSSQLPLALALTGTSCSC